MTAKQHRQIERERKQLQKEHQKRLRATAPELLKMCELAERVMTHTDIHDKIVDLFGASIIPELKSIIRKARGE